MKKIQTIIVSIINLAIFVVSTMTFAATLPSGWYAEGNIGISSVSNDNYGSGTSTTNSNKYGLNANVGYKFMPFFAAEVGYSKYANLNINTTANTGSGTVTQYSYDVAGKGILPIVDSCIDLFAKLGVGRLVTNSKSSTPGITTGRQNATGPYIGAGMEFAFMPAIPVNIQWQRMVGNHVTGHIDLYSVGIAYIFSC